MAWVLLIIAGLFEIAMALTLKASEGFSRLMPTIGFFVFGGISFYLLSRALVAIPVGTAYAVWTGIGAAGTAIFGMIVFKEPATVMRLFFISLLIGSIIGLKAVSN
ncbi:DMT family transporter [Pararhizobium haloflavum]|uniref:DMT family transporter n=1 Tax=Pararhizobium haloflavum TaxID=2037914 RepID=UPI000C1A51DD|nr:multidrug efflux SMR transporter [Pararhizobium haloflavum]